MMSSKEELESMVGLLNEKVFGQPDDSRRLEFRLEYWPDLEGVIAFINLEYGHGKAAPDSIIMPIPPITLCFAGGRDVCSASAALLERFSTGGDLLRKFLPFTAGSLDELKLKMAVAGMRI